MSVKIEIRNRPAPRVAAATGERGQSLYRYELDSVAVRAGNNFLRCTAAEGGPGVERSDTAVRPGKALLGAGRPRTGGVNKCRTPWEQVQGALVPSLAHPLPSGKHGRARSARPCGISRISFPIPQIQRLFRVLGVIGQDCGPKLTPKFTYVSGCSKFSQ